MKAKNIITQESIKLTLSKNIRKIRSSMGLTQNEFAERFKLTRFSLGSYEEGRAVPPINILVMLSEEFGVTINTLVTVEVLNDRNDGKQ